MFETTAVNDHVFSLIKCCSKCYVTIRMHHLGKQRNARMHEKLVHKEYSKLTLFKGQLVCEGCLLLHILHVFEVVTAS
jgi:hypothetical protein